MRDLPPFGFLRLDMRSAHAVTIEKGTWAVEFDLGYQNTWALSSNVEDYLTARESQGRHALGPADVQAIRDLPGENYLLDLESATLDAIVHYKFTENLSGYLILSGVSYQGGLLDGAEFPVSQDSQVIPTLIVGYEHRLTERTNVNGQAYASPSVYSHDETNLDELTATKYEYSIGVRHRFNQCLLTFGITENVQNVNNTPDIGFQLGLAYVPHPARAR